MGYSARGYLEALAGKGQPKDPDTLKFASSKGLRATPFEMGQKVVDGFYERCMLCVEANGSHFKQMHESRHVPFLENDAEEGGHMGTGEGAALENPIRGLGGQGRWESEDGGDDGPVTDAE